jgi:hypothetical protein
MVLPINLTIEAVEVLVTDLIVDISLAIAAKEVDTIDSVLRYFNTFDIVDVEVEDTERLGV